MKVLLRHHDGETTEATLPDEPLPEIIIAQDGETGSYNKHFTRVKGPGRPAVYRQVVAIKRVKAARPVCEHCGGDLGGWSVGRLEHHREMKDGDMCPAFPQ